jgi:predicted dehydrogenase
MGRRHALGYAALERAGASPARLVAVCDPDRSRTAAVTRAFAEVCARRPVALAGLEAALAQREVDAVDLVVPTRFHHSLALAALAAGRHVLVEKPFAITLRAALAALEAAERARLTLAVAENYRRVPTHRALRALVQDGVIGKPYAISVHTVQQAAPSGAPAAWYGDRDVVGSLPNLEFAVHEADLLVHLLGDVEEVTALTGRFESGPDDAGLALLRFAQGALGQLLVLTSGHGGETGGRLLVGSRGRVDSRRWEGWEGGEVRVDGQAPATSEEWTRRWLDELPEPERRRLLPRGAWDESNLAVDIRDPLRYGIAIELHDFASAIASGRAPEVDGEAGLRALAVCLALLESATLTRRSRSPTFCRAPSTPGRRTWTPV